MTNLATRAARRVVAATRDARHARSRRPPRLRRASSSSREPQIYYLSPDPQVPRGGVRVFYRHVDVLNAAGFPATVVHSRRGYRAGWFPNTTRVAAGADVEVTDRDILVVPEFYGASLDRLPSGPRLVVFNQGAYHTFDGIPIERARAYVTHPMDGVLTVSEDSAALLRHTFADVPVAIVRSVIDADVFHPGSTPPAARRRIAYPTNRRDQERHQLLSILEVRGTLEGWDLVPITGMSEAQVADTLRDCAIFLSLSEREGFGLPPAEAMASGCYVVGYTGQGGREFFDPAYCAPVPESSLLDFVRAVEHAAASFDADPSALTNAGLAASKAVLDRYQPARLTEDLVRFFSRL